MAGKKRQIINAGILMQGVLIFTSLIAAHSLQAQLSIENPSNIHRADELIILKRSFIEKKIGNIGEGKYVVITTSNRPVVLQYDDIDNDEKWDEVAFLYSLKPAEKISFSVVKSDAPATIKAVVRAHARHKRKNADDSFGDDVIRDSIPAGQQPTDFSKQALPPFLTEGPAWENDKVGFRLYFDVRNGKDIWGKTTTRMVLDEVGSDPKADYHKQAAWGMDILKVGQSLGAGSLALLFERDNGADTLVRLGGVNMGPVIYEKIADGPVRAIIRLRYPEWKIGDGLDHVAVTEEISIWGGKYFYESNVRVEGAPKNAKLVTGIVNLHSKESHQSDTAGCKILYTYDIQTENKDKLGMAILVKKDQFHAFGTTPNQATDIRNTYTVAVSVRSNEPATFRFYAGWEKSDDRFKSQKGFHEFLGREAFSLTNPLIIK
jgi:hypothetical protein